MKFSVINYFPNLDESRFSELVATISSSGLDLTYVGKSQHPRKWDRDEGSLIELLMTKDGYMNSTAFEDINAYTSLTVELLEIP